MFLHYYMITVKHWDAYEFVTNGFCILFSLSYDEIKWSSHFNGTDKLGIRISLWINGCLIRYMHLYIYTFKLLHIYVYIVIHIQCRMCNLWYQDCDRYHTYLPVYTYVHTYTRVIMLINIYPWLSIELSPLLFVPQLLFAGFFIKTDQIPVFLRWAQYLCSLKYAINLILCIEFDVGNDSCGGAAR